MNPSIHPSINQSINQSINPPTHPFNQNTQPAPTHSPTNPLTNQSTHPPTHQPYKWMNPSIHPSINQSINQSAAKQRTQWTQPQLGPLTPIKPATNLLVRSRFAPSNGLSDCNRRLILSFFCLDISSSKGILRCLKTIQWLVESHGELN